MRVVFLCLFIGFLFTGCATFGITIEPKSERCFHQHLEEYVLTKGKFFVKDPSLFSSEKTNMGVKVYDPDKKVIYETTDFKKGKFYFNTPIQGTYTTCIRNDNTFAVDTFFRFKSGIEAKDYSHLAQLHNIMEVDTQTQWIIDSLYAVQDTVDVIQEHEEDIRSIAMDLDYKVIFFSGITITVLITLSIVQTCILKRRLVKAKLL